MLTKCFNSQCSATFHSLDQGRLFRIDYSEALKKIAGMRPKEDRASRSKTYPIEHFWLCEKCAVVFSVELTAGGEVCLLPIARKPIAVVGRNTRGARKAAAS